MTTLTNEKTKIYKSFRNGWMAETLTTFNGVTWDIVTMKRYNGQVSTSAQQCKKTADEFGTSVSFAMFTDKNISLIAERVICTEKAVRDQHYKALAIFEEKSQTGELPVIVPEEGVKVGQILWLNGYGQDKYYHDRLAVYEIENGRWGTQYKTVNLDKFEIGTQDHVRPEKNIFGIGIYYTPGDTATGEDMGEALRIARQKAADKVKADQAAGILANAKKQAEIEEGSKVISAIPAWGTHIIVGELMEDDSDAMTDYFSSHCETTIYLAFSSHGKDLFSEMRKAAANSQHTEKYAEVPTVDHNGETRTENNKNWWHPEDEHREKWSMGSGYYLGEKFSRSGWQVRKSRICSLQTLQIAAAQGRYFIKDVPSPVSVVQVDQPGKTVTHNQDKNGIEIRFTDKPAPEVLTALKANGFRWSHFNKVWYAKFSPDALRFAEGL